MINDGGLIEILLHAVTTACFVLPSLIERGLAINLQNRMLYKCICELPDEKDCKVSLTPEEEKCVRAFLENTDKTSASKYGTLSRN